MSDPVLFLPGMMCDERLFSPQIAELGETRDVRTLPIHAHDSMEKLAKEVLEEAPARFALAGLSMGGIVAMEVVRQADDRVSRLALLDTNPRAELAEVSAARLPQIEKVKRGGLTDVMKLEMKPNYLADGPHRGRILDLCMDMALGLGPLAFENQSRALAERRDQQDTLSNYQSPSLVLCGEADALCPIERHELMHNLLPNSSLVIVPGAGHLPTLENPEVTTQALKNWLEIE